MKTDPKFITKHNTEFSTYFRTIRDLIDQYDITMKKVDFNSIKFIIKDYKLEKVNLEREIHKRRHTAFSVMDYKSTIKNLNIKKKSMELKENDLRVWKKEIDKRAFRFSVDIVELDEFGEKICGGPDKKFLNKNSAKAKKMIGNIGNAMLMSSKSVDKSLISRGDLLHSTKSVDMTKNGIKNAELGTPLKINNFV